jgi:choline dehydrogenase
MRTSRSENTDPDLWFFGSTGSGFHGFFPGYSNSSDSQSNFWWSIVKMQVQNRAGTVKLRSADPQDVPLINFNYFSEGRDRDLTALKEGVNLALEIFNSTEVLAPFNVTRPAGDIEQDILYQSWGHHATCSCPLGVDKTTSCVDSRFKVHGVENLRIVDGSVFPRVPGAFPVLATYMISDRAADVILEDAQGLA